jgi:predicted signal transduction protein with EAL and GGDEF domain
MGVRLVLDDFGSGQASFASLSQYPLAMVRFESDFFRRAAGSADTAEVTRAMISMVHTLDLWCHRNGRSRTKRRRRSCAMQAAISCRALLLGPLCRPKRCHCCYLTFSSNSKPFSML